MFGMDDPAKVVVQIRSYIGEGRYEIAEVMAQELSTHLLHSKRDIHLDAVLVTALREWVRILHLRGQYSEAHSAARRLAKARRVRLKQIASSGDADAWSDEKQLEVEDLILHGRIESERGHLRSSISRFNKAIRIDANHLEARLSKLGSRWRIQGSLKGGKRDALQLLDALDRSPGVERISGVMGMRNGDGALVSLDRIQSILNGVVDPSLGLNKGINERGKYCLVKIASEAAQIEAGEREADARLAAAIDSLQPSMDYHSYSSS